MIKHSFFSGMLSFFRSQSVLCSGHGVIFSGLDWTADHGTFLNLGERPVNYSCPGQFVANISYSDLTATPVCKLAETEAGAVRRPHVRLVRSFRASTPYVYSVRPFRRFDQSGYSWRCTWRREHGEMDQVPIRQIIANLLYLIQTEWHRLSMLQITRQSPHIFFLVFLGVFFRFWWELEEHE